MNTVDKSLTVPTRSVLVGPLIDPLAGPHQDHSVVVGEQYYKTAPSYGSYYESITPNSGGGRRRWKNFEHFRTEMDSSKTSSMLWRAAAWAPQSTLHFHQREMTDLTEGYPYYDSAGRPQKPYGELGHLDIGLPEFRHANLADGIVIDPVDLEKLQKRSLSVMLPFVKAELSLLNSVYELKDFKSLPGLLTKARKFASSLANKFSIIGKRVVRNSAKKRTSDVRRLTASSYLNYEFNIAPLVDDVFSIWKSIRENERRLNDLISRSAKRQNCHFTWRFDEFADSFEDGDYAGYLYNGLYGSQLESVSLSRSVKYQSSVFHAQLEYNFNYTQYQIEHARLLGLLDQFGINLNPSIIWNALPWTFVVDWLVNVSSWLDSHKRTNMEPQINIHNYLWSIKRTRQITVTKKLNTFSHHVTAGYPSRSQEVPLPTVRQVAYKRSVGTPPTSWIIDSSGLSPKEFSLGAAIVLSRRWQPNRRKR